MLNSGYIKSFLLGIILLIIVIGTVRYFRQAGISQKNVISNPKTTTAIVSRSEDLPSQNPVLQPSPVSLVVPAEKSGNSSIIYSKIISGDYNFSLTTKDGRLRTYRVYVPKNYDSSKKYPILFGFHGGFGTAESFEKSSHLSEFADEREYIAVYGQGFSFSSVTYAPVWNAGACCGRATTNKDNIDDVGYVRSVIAEIKIKYNVDANRIFITGMSNGGMFSNRLACEAADIISGAAIASGTIQINTCVPSKKMPILLMHGTNDANVPYYGGQGSKAVNLSTYIPVEQEFAEWGQRNGCNGEVVTTSIPPLVNDGNTVDRLAFLSCVSPVILYRVNGGIHEWPNGGANSNALEKTSPTKVIDASKTILDFFGL